MNLAASIVISACMLSLVAAHGGGVLREAYFVCEGEWGRDVQFGKSSQSPEKTCYSPEEFELYTEAMSGAHKFRYRSVGLNMEEDKTVVSFHKAGDCIGAAKLQFEVNALEPYYFGGNLDELVYIKTPAGKETFCEYMRYVIHNGL